MLRTQPPRRMPDCEFRRRLAEHLRAHEAMERADLAARVAAGPYHGCCGGRVAVGHTAACSDR